MTNHHGVSVNVQGGGSSTGYRAAKSGAAQIGMLSRRLKAEEADVIPVTIATDAIAVVVHASNPVSGVTTAQLRGIFTGEIRNWRFAGGPDRPIHVITREDGSGTRGSFDETVIGDGMVMSSAVVQDSNGAILETVASDPNAIGYVSLGLVDDRVRAVALDGVPPTHDTARSGEYKIVRPFIFATRGKPAGIVKEFIDFVLSDHGQAVLEENGLIREKTGERQ